MCRNAVTERRFPPSWSVGHSPNTRRGDAVRDSRANSANGASTTVNRMSLARRAVGSSAPYERPKWLAWSGTGLGRTGLPNVEHKKARRKGDDVRSLLGRDLHWY